MTFRGGDILLTFVVDVEFLTALSGIPFGTRLSIQDGLEKKSKKKKKYKRQ